MKLKQVTFIDKGFALIRFLFVRIFYYKSLRINKISYIGKHLRLYIIKGGSIAINGKINIKDYVELQAKGDIVFGNKCSINRYSRIVAFDKITLGDRVVIAQYVSILDHDHNYVKVGDELKIDGYKTEPINIGNNVWVGDKVTITKGVTIGNNVIIAANSVVTNDIESNSLYGGVPAKFIKSID